MVISEALLKMNVLLVYPEYPDTFWSFKHILKYISKKATFPPLGLLTVAAMLPEEWGKKLVDMNTRKLEDKDLEWADTVMVSAMLVQKNSAQNVISRAKAKGRMVVAGGPAFSAMPEQFRQVDHMVLGEAEITLPRFLRDLENGKPKKFYKSKQRPDITKTPKPLWELIDFKDYQSMVVQYSRGCPFNCEFCDIVIMNGHTPRTKNPEQIISELQSLHDAGWRSGVFIVDDNFIGNKIRVKEMLRSLIKWQKQHKYPFQFLTEASTNLADDPELMILMSKANFSKVFLGLETPNIESLKECSKMQNATRDLADSVRIIQRNGMQVMGGFIVGFDNDFDSIFENQIKFIQKIGVVTAMVGILTALPHTRLWHRLNKEGRLLKESTGDIDGDLNFMPKMGREKLIKGYKKILSTIYSPKEYYKRINTFIMNYRPTAKSRINLSSIKAFVRSIWKVGILSRSRFYYWKLLFKTFLMKNKAFPIAVELAIIGEHFKRTTKKIVSAKAI